MKLKKLHTAAIAKFRETFADSVKTDDQLSVLIDEKIQNVATIGVEGKFAVVVITTAG